MAENICQDCGERAGIGFTLNGPGHTVYFCAECVSDWFDGVW